MARVTGSREAAYRHCPPTLSDIVPVRRGDCPGILVNISQN